MSSRTRRVSIFRNGYRTGGRVVAVPDTLEELTAVAKSKLNLPRVRWLFNESGDEVDSTAVVFSGDKLYFSSGEPFEVPTCQDDPRGLIFYRSSGLERWKTFKMPVSVLRKHAFLDSLRRVEPESYGWAEIDCYEETEGGLLPVPKDEFLEAPRNLRIAIMQIPGSVVKSAMENAKEFTSPRMPLVKSRASSPTVPTEELQPVPAELEQLHVRKNPEKTSSVEDLLPGVDVNILPQSDSDGTLSPGGGRPEGEPSTPESRGDVSTSLVSGSEGTNEEATGTGSSSDLGAGAAGGERSAGTSGSGESQEQHSSSKRFLGMIRSASSSQQLELQLGEQRDGSRCSDAAGMSQINVWDEAGAAGKESEMPKLVTLGESLRRTEEECGRFDAGGIKECSRVLLGERLALQFFKFFLLGEAAVQNMLLYEAIEQFERNPSLEVAQSIVDKYFYSDDDVSVAHALLHEVGETVQDGRIRDDLFASVKVGLFKFLSSHACPIFLKSPQFSLMVKSYETDLKSPGGKGLWNTQMHRYAMSGSTSKIEALLNKGCPPDVLNKQYFTPLHFCGQEGKDKAAALLIDRGADRDPVNVFGETPLHLACRSDSAKVVRLLLDRGADVGVLNAQENTPLEYVKRAAVRSMFKDSLLKEFNANAAVTGREVVPLLKWSMIWSVRMVNLDNDHEAIFKTINKAHAVLKSGEGDLSSALENIFERMRQHFVVEEEILMKLNYARLPVHRKDHRFVETDFKKLISDFRSGIGMQQIWKRFLAQVKYFAFDHVWGMDKDYVQYLVQT